MIQTVVGKYNWLPFDVYRFFLDARDPRGLRYWALVAEDDFWNGLDDEQKQKFQKSFTNHHHTESFLEDRNRFQPHVETLSEKEYWFLKR